MAKEFPQNIQGLINDSRRDKIAVRRAWNLSLKFLEGRQWLSYDKRLGSYVTATSSEGSSRVTVNLLLNIYRNVLSRLALAYPGVVVIPASPSYEDILKAKSSETALRYYWHKDDVPETIEHLIKWLLTTGTAALHTFYDPGMECVRTEAVGAYDIFFEQAVINPDDSRWVALRSYVDREDLKEAYPNKAEEIENAPAPQEPDYGQINPAPNEGPPKDRVEVFDIYWRDGRHAVVTGSTYLFKQKQMPTKTFPVQIIRYTEIPRRLWGKGLIEPLVDLQMLYNRARSQVVHNVELMGNPKWLVPKTAGVSTHAITSKPGEKIYYNQAGGTPQQVAAAPLPSYIADNITRLQAEMGDVAGLHSVSLGKRAVGVTSGKAIQALASHDTSQLQISQAAIEKGAATMARCVLELMKEFYTEAKMMSMLDQYGRVTFASIQSTNIVDTPEVFIEAGSLFRDEAQDRDAKVMELAQAGMITPQQALQELSFRTGNAFVSEKVQAMAHAKDMLDAARLGARVEVFMSDDLEAFGKVFGEFMQTEEFYLLTPERQDYLRDVLLSIEAAGQPDEVYRTLLGANKVFPRSQPPTLDPQTMAANMAAPASPNTQEQIIQEQSAAATRAGSMAEAERLLTGRNEALMGRGPGTGGL